jgi:DNA uptake protein ComE-like DNA-binding protein
MKHRSAPFLLKRQWLGFALLLAMVGSVRLFIAFLPEPVPDGTLLPDSVLSVPEWRQAFQHDTLVLCLRPFDPNTADSLTLRQLGLRPWQVRNLLKYRAKNGRFRKKEDFRRLYGLTDSAYSVLEPYIAIVPSPRDSFRFEALPDSLRPHYVSRKRDTILELNGADTASLQMIRGIGPYTALRIVRYRSRLGGFVSPEQLRETGELSYGCWDSVIPHFVVNTDSVRRLPVNYASLERLCRHPYLSFEQAKAVYTLRRRRIRLHGMDELQAAFLSVDGQAAVSGSSVPLFTDSTLSRLAPYLDFRE